jgi:hypothetical protein
MSLEYCNRRTVLYPIKQDRYTILTTWVATASTPVQAHGLWLDALWTPAVSMDSTGDTRGRSELPDIERLCARSHVDVDLERVAFSSTFGWCQLR